MLATLVPGAISILLAAALVGPVAFKVNSPALWVVIVVGLGLMVATLVEALRQEQTRN